MKRHPADRNSSAPYRSRYSSLRSRAISEASSSRASLTSSGLDVIGARLWPASLAYHEADGSTLGQLPAGTARLCDDSPLLKARVSPPDAPRRAVRFDEQALRCREPLADDARGRRTSPSEAGAVEQEAVEAVEQEAVEAVEEEAAGVAVVGGGGGGGVPPTVTVADEELFAKFESGLLALTDTEAVLVIAPSCVGFAAIVTVLTSPASSQPRSQATTVPLAQMASDVVVETQLSPAGSSSVSFTSRARAGP